MHSQNQNTRPTAEDAARRLIILKHIVASALAAPPRDKLQQMTARFGDEERAKLQQQAEAQRDKFWSSLRESGWWSHFSPSEQAHAQSTMVTMTERQQIDAYWRKESAVALMWALGLLPELPAYDTVATAEILKQIPSRDGAAFVKSARLREQAELERARGTAELWHWRSRTRQLIERGDAFPADAKMHASGFRSYDDIVRFTARKAAQEGTIPPCIAEDFPASGKAYRDLTDEEWSQTQSITTERHYALNWLCGCAPDNKWDETPTGT